MVDKSLERLESFHAELYRSSDAELRRELEIIINLFKRSLFNALCDVHEFYEDVLLNERLTQSEKIFEARRFADNFGKLGPPIKKGVITGTFGPGRQPPPSVYVQPATPRCPPPMLSDEKPINYLVDSFGREWEVEEVLLDVTTSGLGFSISGGLNRPPDSNTGDRHIRVTAIEPGGAVFRDGRIRVGDVLLRINDVDCYAVNHEVAVNALQISEQFIRLLVKRLKPIQHQRSQSHSNLLVNGYTSSLPRQSSQKSALKGQSESNIPRSQSWHQLVPSPPVPSPRSTSSPMGPKRSAIVRSSIAPQPIPVPPTVTFQTPPTVAPPGSEHRLILVQKSADLGFGFNIVGGEDGEPIYVSYIQPGGPAEQTQLFVGDMLIRINEIDLRAVTHSHVATVLRSFPAGTTAQFLVQHRPKDFHRFEEKVERHNREQLRSLQQRQQSIGR